LMRQDPAIQLSRYLNYMSRVFSEGGRVDRGI